MVFVLTIENMQSTFQGTICVQRIQNVQGVNMIYNYYLWHPVHVHCILLQTYVLSVKYKIRCNPDTLITILFISHLIAISGITVFSMWSML
jgi:hypothetical protein